MSTQKYIKSYLKTCTRAIEQSPFFADIELPYAKDYQQTLRSSFTMAGIGLHSAEFSFIRLRPTNAREGRYFVSVPQGFISEDSSLMTTQKNNQDTKLSSGKNLWKARLKNTRVEAFLSFYSSVATGYEGSLEEFEEEIYNRDHINLLEDFNGQLNHFSKPEDFKQFTRSDEDISCPATIKFARGEVYYTSLERHGLIIKSVEHILASLEACGVDNCRIEIENGTEVPIIDGSAHGWTTLITRLGVIPCEEKTTKQVIKTNKPILLNGNDDSFVGISPSPSVLITAGWDAVSRGAPCFGRSWFTWDVDHDLHFHYSIAPAKTFYHSTFELDALYDSGLVQAGPTFCAIVGMGESLHDPAEVSFPDDETARHKVLDLTGDLALLSREGNGGLPRGHVLSWTTDHILQTKFCALVCNDLGYDDGYKAQYYTTQRLKRNYSKDEKDRYPTTTKKKEPIEAKNLQRINSALEAFSRKKRH
jgi:UDP-3-O-acyl-N-acetylglucosamine deacetylase